jgi:hypothetical protein
VLGHPAKPASPNVLNGRRNGLVNTGANVSFMSRLDLTSPDLQNVAHDGRSAGVAERICRCRQHSIISSITFAVLLSLAWAERRHVST